jgi:hypothetical protein
VGSTNSLRGGGQDPAKRLAGGHTVNLQDEVMLVGWPTPCAAEPDEDPDMILARNQRQRDRGVNIGTAMTLSARAKMAGWPTPMAENSVRSEAFRKGREPNPMEVAIGPARITAGGQMLTGSSAAMASGGQLSPHMSRWLMGLPPQWCECAIMAHEQIKAKRGKK